VVRWRAGTYGALPRVLRGFRLFVGPRLLTSPAIDPQGRENPLHELSPDTTSLDLPEDGVGTGTLLAARGVQGPKLLQTHVA